MPNSDIINIVDEELKVENIEENLSCNNCYISINVPDINIFAIVTIPFKIS